MAYQPARNASSMVMSTLSGNSYHGQPKASVSQLMARQKISASIMVMAINSSMAAASS
jgi:hypothetical protein